MSKLVVATLVRNEAKRYLPSALRAWSKFADKIVALDDNSEDDTLKLLIGEEKCMPCVRYGETQAWGAEANARRELFKLVQEETEPGDYVIWLDADMVPLADPREFATGHADTVYFVLYDLWGEDAHGRPLYRDDAFWCGHYRPRAWMIRMPGDDFKPQWMERGLHCGHLPLNWDARNVIFAPASHALLHYAYADEADRHEKMAAYLKQGEQLSAAELAHARSIVDEAPALKPLFVKPKWRLVHE